MSEYITDLSYPTNLGFIITRHVKNESHNNLWVMCIQRIRLFYPTTLIVIIDDNSDYDYIKYPTGLLDNCIVIESVFKGAGELLPYYYYYNNKWFEKAIFIHDSVFINSPVDVSNTNNVKFLWEFMLDCQEEYCKNDWFMLNIRNYILEYLSYLNYGKELIDFFNAPNKWIGCFGVMSVINHSYIQKLVDKYNMLILLNHVKTRSNRMAMERVFAVLCFYDNGISKENTSIYGSYNLNGKYNYNTYLEAIQNGTVEMNPSKIYNAR